MIIRIIQILSVLLIICAVPLVVMRMHGVRLHRWRWAVLLALAGVVSSFLVVVANFEPVQQTVFPFRYEAGDTWMGQQWWTPHDAPKWLTSLAEHGRIIRLWPERTEMVDGVLESGVVMGPGHFSSVAYYDPNFVCGVPGAEPRDPSTVPGVITYRGARALWYYAYGLFTPLRGIFYIAVFGICSAVVFVLLRRLSSSAGMRAAFGRVDRARVLVRAAWWSIAWPGAAVLAHAFFFDLHMARVNDGVMLGIASPLPLALGRVGVGGIWLGAILGSVLTFSCVALRAAAKQTASGDTEPVCDACGYPVADPHTRCPECGTHPDTDSSPGGWKMRIRRPVLGVLWVLVGVLLCAPVTLPLLGAVVPKSLIPG